MIMRLHLSRHTKLWSTSKTEQIDITPPPLQSLCDTWAFLWTTSTRMSVFLIALLSVSRAYILCFPFSAVRRRVVLAAMVVAGTLTFTGTSIPFWWREHHFYHPALACCSVFTQGRIPAQARVLIEVIDYFGIFCPLPVILLSFGVTLWRLGRKRGKRLKGFNNNVAATNTIVLFTGKNYDYVFCYEV